MSTAPKFPNGEAVWWKAPTGFGPAQNFGVVVKSTRTGGYDAYLIREDGSGAEHCIPAMYVHRR